MNHLFVRRKTCSLLLLGLSLAVGSHRIAGAQASALSLGSQISTDENLWDAGKTFEYYQRAHGIINEIKSESGGPGSTNLNGLAITLLNNLLSKHVKLNEADDRFEVEDLSTMESVFGYLDSRPAASPEERRQTALLLSRYLGRIREEIIPNFKAKPVVQNVMPPAGTPGPVIAGMDPDAIRDPQARQKYEAAIRQNRLNAVENGRQIFLLRCEIIARDRIVKNIVESFDSGALSTSDLEKCMALAGMTEAEKSNVTSRIPNTK
jgi:hypothetical protein